MHVGQGTKHRKQVPDISAHKYSLLSLDTQGIIKQGLSNLSEGRKSLRILFKIHNN